MVAKRGAEADPGLRPLYNHCTKYYGCVRPVSRKENKRSRKSYCIKEALVTGPVIDYTELQQFAQHPDEMNEHYFLEFSE